VRYLNLRKKREGWGTRVLISIAQRCGEASEAAGGGGEQAHGKDAALVGVYVAGGAEHGGFAGEARGTDAREKGFWREIPRGCADAVKEGEPGGDGADAGQEGGAVHVAVSAAVEAIDEAGLGGQADFIQKRLADERADGLRRRLFAAFRGRWRRNESGILKNRYRHE
jgi:hypothetical protein